MKINKKALVAAVTLSMWAGCYGNALAADSYLFGAESDYSDQTVVEGKAKYTEGAPTEGAVATGASFTVKGGAWSYVYGGYDKKIYGSEVSVSDNTVTITGGRISNTACAGIAFGTGTDTSIEAKAVNNILNINNYTNDSNMAQVYGGYTWSKGASCTVNNNKVNITDSQLKAETVAAAYGRASASDKTITAENNAVAITNSKVTGDVYAVYETANYGSNSLTAKNNTVELNKATVTGTIYGAYKALMGTVAEATGNTLKVTSTDNSVGGIGAIDSAGTRNSFQAINFELPAESDGKTMLTSSAAVDLTGVSSFNVVTTNYTKGNTITLLSSAEGITNLAENALKIDGEAATKKGEYIKVDGMDNAFRDLGYTYDKEGEAVKAIKFGLSDYYLTADSTVSQDVTLDVRLDAKNKSITIGKDKKLNADQGISNAGTINNYGILNLGADSALGSIVKNGVTNITGGTTTVSGNVNQGSIKISEGACYKQTGGTAILGAYFSNYGTVQFSLPGNFGIAPTVNGNGKMEILAGNVSANNFTQGELLVAEGAGFTCNESFKVDQITNNGTLSRGGSSYNNTAGSITGTGTTSLTGTLTVNGNFTQKGLTVGEGGNYTQTAGHFVVNGEVTNSGTVTLQNLGGTATKDFTAAENKVTGTLTNNGTFTLDNTNLTVNAFTGNTVKVENESKLTIVNGDIPSGGGDITGDLKVTSGSTAEIVAPTVVHGDFNVDETSTLKVEGTSLTATENGAKVTIGTLTGDGKGELKLSACNVMQEGLVNIGNAAQIAINVAPVGATVLAGVENLDAAIANINAKGIDALVKNLGEGASFNLQEGAIYGETSYIGSASGKATKISKPNTANQAVSNACSSAAAFGRIEMNDIRKRLGDVRLAEAEDGFWTRYENGKLQGAGNHQHLQQNPGRRRPQGQRQMAHRRSLLLHQRQCQLQRRT